MQRSLNRSSGGRRIFGVPTVGILAEQIAAETAAGDYGPGILYNEALQPEHAGKYLRARMLGFPATGILFVYENGAYDITGLPDGTHVFPYEFCVDNVLQPGTANLPVALGLVDAAAPGATLTGTATITPGSATGEMNASAPGATLTGTATLEPGAASGAVSGAAPGATLTGTASLTPGAATGESNASAPGADLTGTATLTHGTAEAINGGTAPGVTLTGTASITPGSATGEVSATAPGATLTGSATLTPGTAIGDLHASAPGVTLTGTASIIAGGASNGEGITAGPDNYRVRSPLRVWRAASPKRSWTAKSNSKGLIMPLPIKDPEEIKTVTFDFTGDAATIAAAEVTAISSGGLRDATPANVLGAEQTIDGALVYRRIKLGQPGSTYTLRCKATDADGEVHVVSAYLPVAVQVPQ